MTIFSDMMYIKYTYLGETDEHWILAVITNVIKQWDKGLLFKSSDNIEDVVMVLDSDTTIVYA